MNNSVIFFRTRVAGPRLLYTVNELFDRRLGLKVNIVDESADLPPEHFCIHYGIPGGHCFFPSSGILEEEGSGSYACWPQEQIQDSVLERPGSEGVSGDLPGLVFWMLSRYEEYTQPQLVDAHGRFPSLSNSLIRNNLHEEPLVEKWIHSFAGKLNQSGIRIVLPPSELQISFDFDNPTAFLYKGWGRTMMSSIRDLATLNLRNLYHRIQVLSGQKKDPYETMAQLEGVCRNHGIAPMLFVWIGNYGPYDKGLKASQPYFQKQIKELAGCFSIGLHPSYASFLNPEKVMEEKKRLEAITGEEVVACRFHYLRFRTQESYSMLESLGFKEDYSMGFPEFSGFRAGTGNSFLWYDFKNERASGLLIHPFGLMDSAARFHCGWNAKEFLEKVQLQRNAGRLLGFSPHTLFHNEHPSWPGWESVVDQVLRGNELS